MLFPVAAGTRDGQPPGTRARALRVALEGAAVCVAAGTLLFRVGGIPSWDLVYAEDGGVFLVQALAHPWHLLDPFGGYLELVPRIIGQFVSFLPLRDAAKAFAVTGALVAAVCALFTFHASEGYIRSPWLRGLLGAALILLPLAPIEMADSAVDSPWYLLLAAFWAVMWRPRAYGGMLAAALVAFAATSSEILTVVYLPLLAIRVLALPRLREHAVTAGFLLGLLAKAPAILSTYSHHQQRLSGYGSPVASAKFYLHAFVLRSLGWHVSWSLQGLLGLNGATAVVAALLVAVLAWAMITGDRQVRVFAVLATVLGFAEVMVCASVPGPNPGWVSHQVADRLFQPGSRYDALPVMLLDATVIIAVDHFTRRRRAALAGPRDAAARPPGAARRRSPAALGAGGGGAADVRSGLRLGDGLPVLHPQPRQRGLLGAPGAQVAQGLRQKPCRRDKPCHVGCPEPDRALFTDSSLTAASRRRSRRRGGWARPRASSHGSPVS
jgi:hypothetical protein